MNPIKIVLKGGVRLLVVPDVEVHLDGHVAICYRYSIYADNDLTPWQIGHPKNGNPNYRGKIVFEVPGRLFNYIADEDRLDPFEMQELVERLTHYRENPHLWPAKP